MNESGPVSGFLNLPHHWVLGNTILWEFSLSSASISLFSYLSSLRVFREKKPTNCHIKSVNMWDQILKAKSYFLFLYLGLRNESIFITGFGEKIEFNMRNNPFIVLCICFIIWLLVASEGWEPILQQRSSKFALKISPLNILSVCLFIFKVWILISIVIGDEL